MLSLSLTDLKKPTAIFERLSDQQGERLAIAAHLVAGLLISASLMIYPGSELATPALMLVLALLLAPPLGFVLSLRTDLEWLLLSRIMKVVADKQLPTKNLLASQMLGVGLISLLVSFVYLVLHRMASSDYLFLLLICLGMLLFLWLLWTSNRLEVQQLGITTPWRFLLVSMTTSLLWCGGITLVGWLFILALRHSLLADLNLMMMFF